MSRAIYRATCRAMASAAIVLTLIAPALADPKRDLDACVTETPDIAACDRVIANRKESRDNLAAAHFNRGTAYYNQANHKAALADLDRAIALKKDYANAYYNRALALKQLGEHPRALADFGAYIRIDPDDPDVHLDRGSLHLDMRNLDLALADYEKALKLKPGSEPALLGLGKIFVEKGDENNARRNFDAAIKLNANATNYIARADALAAFKRLDEAAADYEAAIKADPSNADGYSGRAWVHGEQREYAKTAELYTEAIRLSPGHADFYNGRGWSYLELYDYARAKSDLDRALSLNPQHGLALFNRGRVFLELGQFDAALADLDAAERAKADTQSVPIYRGWVFSFKGDQDRAIVEFRKSVPVLPDDPAPYNGLCWAHAHKNEFDKATPHCDKAVALAPNDGDVLHTRGVAKFLMGAHGVALADFDQAAATKADMASIYADRGRVHEARGERARAVADYQKAMSLPSKGYYDDISKAEALRRLTAFATAAPQQAVVQSKPEAPQTPERRVALVIGNAAYQNVPALLNPKNDARAIASALKRLGFATVVEQYDLTRPAMTRALQDFGELAENADWAVVYYAGHGIEVGGVNYAIPVEAALKASTHVDDEGVSLERVMTTVGAAKKMRLVILDACRDNPFVPKMRTVGGTRSVGRGLGRIEPPPGVLVAYAARDGLVAQDGDTGNSPFASALVEYLEEPGLEINLLFRKVHDRVLTNTRGQQQPFTYGALPAQQFFFRTAQP
jgi:tetratricopeptide (TPR) repeat protein